MAKNTEIELKLVISKDNLKKLLQLDCVAKALREGSCQKRRLVSSYYDTEDLAFKRQGIAYRVRSKGDGTYEATVKTRIANGAGLSERVELNIPLKSARPQLTGFAELGLASELTELAPNGVSKLFTVTVQRTTYILDLEGAVAELAVDHGKITAGQAVDKIDEVEIELLEGDKGALLGLAAAIAREIPVFVEKRSKFTRGLALRGIGVDAAPLQEKLGTGLAKDELMGAVAAHGEQLMALKDALEANVSEKALKTLRRELLTLRSLGQVAGAAPCPELEDSLALVEQVRRLLGLQVLWQSLVLKGQLKGRTSLQRKLSEATMAAMAALQGQVCSGRFTTIVFALTSAIYAAELGDEAVEDRIKASIKAWQQVLLQKVSDKAAAAEAAEPEASELVASELAEDKLIAAENICALARCCSIKSAAKASEAAKKQRRQLNKEAVLAAWQELLAKLSEGSSSKNLYREVGMVQGYLLAKA